MLWASEVGDEQASSHRAGRPASAAQDTPAATSYRSDSPSPNSPSLVPWSDDVPRLLNRSTASWARAGRRKAAFLNRWLSIMPPWVGSGWRQISVATGSASAGRASSPTSRSPSAVGRVTGVRLAGSTVAARISLMGLSFSSSAEAAAQPVLPARAVPVPALADADVDPLGGPGHHVRPARRALLGAARAAVGLRGARAGLLPHHPVPLGPGFDALGPRHRRRRTRALAADPARTHTCPPYAATLAA